MKVRLANKIILNPYITEKTFELVETEKKICFIVEKTSTKSAIKDAINAIKVMEVRGAPLIGGTAAYGIVLAIMEKNDPNFIKKSSEDLIQSRPTAINLKWAVDRMMKKYQGLTTTNY